MYPLLIPLCSLLTSFPKLSHLSWTSHSASQAVQSVLYFTTKTSTLTATYTTPLLILSTAKMVFRHLCFEDDDFLQKCEEISTFFESLSLQFTAEGLGKGVSSVNRQEALVKRVREKEERIPLVMTYHTLSSRVKHILINNFNILTGDPATAAIFPDPPVITHRRDLSPRDILVHTSDRFHTEVPLTFACRHPRCRTCLNTTSNSHVCGPKVQPPSVNALPVNHRTLCNASRKVDSHCYTSGRPVVPYANDSAKIFGASKRTLVLSRPLSTSTLSGTGYQSSL